MATVARMANVPLIISFRFLSAIEIPYPTAMVHTACIRPEPKPLTNAHKKLTLAGLLITLCESITVFSSTANPTPQAKEMLSSVFLSFEMTNA